MRWKQGESTIVCKMKLFDNNIKITNSHREHTNIELVADDHQPKKLENHNQNSVVGVGVPLEENNVAPAAAAGDHHHHHHGGRGGVLLMEGEADNNNNNDDDDYAHAVPLQWRLVIVEICFTAIGVAVQALQTPNPVNVTFQFRCFRTAMVISFASLLMSVYVYRYSESAALMFEHIGVFFGVVAFLLAVTLD